MKILYIITQSELGGAQKYVLDLASRLKGEHEIMVACGEQGEGGELASELQNLDIACLTIPHLKRKISFLDDLLATLEMTSLIRKLTPDIVHLNSSKVSIIGSFAVLITIVLGMFSSTKNQHAKIIYTAHGWVFNEPLLTWKKTFYRYAEKLSAHLKDRIICVSEFDRITALKENIALPEKLITVHNGRAPVSFLDRDEARETIISKSGKPDIFKKKLSLITIGNLYPSKGYAYSIEATRILVQEMRVDTSYLIIGEGEERKNLERLIKQSRLEDYVIIAGRIPEASRLLKAFDLYVCPSVKEGLSYTLIEAMQAGLPIIATKVGGNPELIDKLSGIIIPPHDPAEIAKQVAKLAGDHLKRSLFGTNAQARAFQYFTDARMIVETLAIYRNE